MKHQYSPRHQALMAVLKEFREAAGMTQGALSLKVGRSRTFMHRVEVGARVIDYLEALDVCEALERDPSELQNRVLNYGKQPTVEPIEVKDDPIVVTAEDPTPKRTKPKPKPKNKR